MSCEPGLGRCTRKNANTGDTFIAYRESVTFPSQDRLDDLGTACCN